MHGWNLWEHVLASPPNPRPLPIQPNTARERGDKKEKVVVMMTMMMDGGGGQDENKQKSRQSRTLFLDEGKERENLQ